MYKRILLPTDGSKLSSKAVTQGIRLAKSLGARVTAVTIVPEYQMMADEGFALPAAASARKRFEDAQKRRGRATLGGVKAEAAAAGVECDAVVTSGAPYDAIIKQAKKARCDAIMMASHGRKGLSGILLGSETTKVLTHSTLPVIVVR